MKSGYYSSGTSAGSLHPRVMSIMDYMEEGSVVFDIGCLDGTIGLLLLASGHAKKVYGIDIVDKWDIEPDPNFHFQKMDIMNTDINRLPEADHVLFLNVMHHLIQIDQDRSFWIFNKLLDKYRSIFFDMGSITENYSQGSNPDWRQTLEDRFIKDKNLEDDLFSNSEQAIKLLTYPQRGGHRTLWLITK